ncbi:MAG: GNAT family N-acetyltransferase [Actinomycetota bacterium]|nr:GNAT family N-acetyltransferase [Actinomycetota bacterium]
MAVSVLWVIKGLGPGGAERLLVSLAGAHDPEVASYECAFVLPWKRHLVPQLEARGVPCRCVAKGRRDPLWPLRLARMVRSGGYDIVHVHSPLPGSVARLAVRSLPRSKRPVVYTTEHNAWGTFRLPTRVLNRLTSRRDHFTFAVSTEVEGSLRGPVVDHAGVLVHGIDLPGTRAELAGREAMRAELGVAGGEVVVVTVANFRTQKDYPTLLHACAELQRRGVPFRLLAVGQGPLEEEMRALHRSLDLGGSVQLLGYREDAVAVLAAADAFVLASRWEGLPVALMEATALGLPAVLTEVGGMPEAMGADGALWVPPGRPHALADALQQLVEQPELRSMLGERSLTASAAFDVRRAARAIERRYVPPVPGWAPPVGLEHIEICRARPEHEQQAIELCQLVLSHQHEGDWPALFRWKHRRNPFGPSPMWVAVDDGRVVAVRVFMRWEFRRDGRVVRAVRAVDTATHPDYQGKGLFTALTLQGLAEVAAEGVELVFNTPNDQSRPGYLKMGWQEVGRLAPVAAIRSPFALARVMKSRVPAELWPVPLAVGVHIDEWLAAGGFDRYSTATPAGRLATALSPDLMRWRFGSALQPCRVLDDGNAAAVIECRTRGAVTELVCLLGLGEPVALDRLLRRTMREVRADTVLRLGQRRPATGFFPMPAVGPRLTCRMLGAEPVPKLPEWALTLGDVVLF